MKHKNIKTKHILIGIVILIIIILAIFSITLKNDRQPSKIESLIKDTTTGVMKVVSIPFNFVWNKIEDFKELVNIREKYQMLLTKVDRIESLETENIELRNQLESLKKELKIDYTINGYDFLNATVISRNVSYWYNTITIDKGTYNGVEKDMVVVNNKGLIGKVISTTTFTSEVRLLTTNDTLNKISIAISNNNNNKIYGLIKGYNYNNNYLEVEGISNEQPISIGNYVYTSGLGGIFPSGILIGTVKEITTDEYDLSKMINVTPSVDFNDINYVAILRRKEIKKWLYQLYTSYYHFY